MGGKSYEREGLFGNKYTEHYNSNGNKIGESHEREGLFGGKYTEHSDTSGRKTGESREREGFFGNEYTEHEGAGHRGDESKNDSGSSSWCFITTACARAKGLPDNCRELVTLRQFRDDYVALLPEGPALIAEYYRIAPAILSDLDQAPDSDRLYEEIFRQLRTAVEHILRKPPHDALETYRRMVSGLAERMASSKADGH